MATASSEHDSLYGSATHKAWLTFALVDTMLQLEEAFFPAQPTTTGVNVKI